MSAGFSLILWNNPYSLLRKLVFFGITAAAIAVFVVINASLNGLLTNRILSEIKIMFSSDVQFYDLKDITFSENKVSIVSSTETLNIVKNSEELSFYDTSGNILNINQKNKNDEITITFEEEGYKGKL